MKKILIFIFAVMLAGCRHTEYVTVEKFVEKHDTLREVKTLFDTAHVRDSIYFYEWIKGDTVYKEKYKERVEYRERVRTDTVYRSKLDSVVVPTPYPVIKYVDKPLKKWQKGLMGIGVISLLGLIVFAYIKIRQRFL